MADEESTSWDETVETGTRSEPESVTLSLSSVSEQSFTDRYQTLRRLGEGGMGEVLLCADKTIGRQVALKVMRPEAAVRSTSQQRFVREARVQGQLEHPSIVPVYDLGRNGDELYFTMKRVRGETLQEIVAGLREQRASFDERYSRHRLLTAFTSLCLAIDYAHQHGVLHRDLKPANVMLGDFGEVYVLDWGLARLGDKDEPVRDDSTEVKLHSPSGTRDGTVLGTPGYMPPEQARGRREALGPASDVYSLGCVLYELLTYEPIMEEAPMVAMLTRTVDGVDARASVRAPQAMVPPELESICRRATAMRSEDRYPSARALHDALEEFLAGQRDTTLRRDVANQHADRAAAAIASSRELESVGTIEMRRTAMREIGRALALDPENARAIEVMTRLLTEAPSELPPEVTYEIERARAQKTRWTGRVGMWTFGSLVFYLPLFVWADATEWTSVLVFYALAAICSGLSGWTARQRRPTELSTVAVMTLSNAMFLSLWSLFGPLIVLPPVLVANTVAFAVQMRGAARVFAIGLGSACALTPILLEVLGVVGPSFHFDGSDLVLHGVVLGVSPGATLLLVGSASVVAIITVSLALARVRDTLDDAERRLYVYAWHLREIVPTSARRATDPVARRAS